MKSLSLVLFILLILIDLPVFTQNLNQFERKKPKGCNCSTNQFDDILNDSSGIQFSRNNHRGNTSDLLVCYNWNTTLNDWVPSYKWTTNYDIKGNRVEYILSWWSFNYWQDDEKTYYYYDSNEYLIQSTKIVWHNLKGIWEDSKKETFTYDSNGNLSKRIGYSFFYQWFQTEKTIFSFDTKNNLLEEIWFDCDFSDTLCSFDHKITYTYDNLNNLINKSGFTRKANIWDNEFLWTYNYDINNKPIELIYKVWTGSTWENSLRYNYTYETNSYLVESFRYTWNGYNWLKNRKTTITNDEHGNKVESIGYKRVGSNWIMDSKCTHPGYYASGIFNPVYSKIQNKIRIFPNPMTHSLTVQITSVINNQVVTFTLYNSQGKEIINENITLSQSNTFIFNRNGLSSGLYFYSIKDKKSVIGTGKIVLQ